MGTARDVGGRKEKTVYLTLGSGKGSFRDRGTQGQSDRSHGLHRGSMRARWG